MSGRKKKNDNDWYSLMLKLFFMFGIPLDLIGNGFENYKNNGIEGVIMLVILLIISLLCWMSVFEKAGGHDYHPNMTGIQYERFVAKKLAKQGYTNIEMTPKSGDFGVDILARKNGMRIAIQCKRYSGSVGVHAIQEVEGGRKYYGCDKAIVITDSSFTTAAEKMADRIGVRLVDKFR